MTRQSHLRLLRSGSPQVPGADEQTPDGAASAPGPVPAAALSGPLHGPFSLHLASDWTAVPERPVPDVNAGEQVRVLCTMIEQARLGDRAPVVFVTAAARPLASLIVTAAVSALGGGRARRVSAARTAAAAVAEPLGSRDVLVVDPGECLWQQPGVGTPPPVQTLAESVRQGVAVVVLESASLDVLPASAAVGEIFESAHLALHDPADDELRHLLTAPARAAGVRLRDDLVDRLLEETTSSASFCGGPEASRSPVGALALLTAALRGMWGRREQPESMTLGDLRAIGGLGAATDQLAESAICALSPAGQASLWTVLGEMVRREGAAPALIPAPLGRLSDEPCREVVTALCEHGLLRRSATEVQVSHELLLSYWVRLRQWIETAQRWSPARRLVARYAVAWEEAGRSAELLLSARVMQHLEEIAQARGVYVQPGPGGCPALMEPGRGEIFHTWTEREFLTASRRARPLNLCL